MSEVKPHNRWLVWVGFLISLLLMIYPLSPQLQWFRPEWVALLVIYWTIKLPLQVSLTPIWLLGLFLDVLEGSLLGLHALALMGVVYVCLLTYQRFQNYVLWHQSLLVFVMVGIHQLVDNWVHSLSGSAAQSLIFLLPALISALAWPLLWIVLEQVRVRYRIT